MLSIAVLFTSLVVIFLLMMEPTGLEHENTDKEIEHNANMDALNMGLVTTTAISVLTYIISIN